jgi:pimeloyl-ACP methyl ester carboxylesterase
MTPDERRDYLNQLLKTLPPAPAWQKWLESSGELPPDFDALPRMNSLPDPLRFLDGRLVRTTGEWDKRRDEIKSLFEKYALGTFPPHPKLDGATVVDETQGKGYRIRHVQLQFGPQSRGKLRVELLIPDGKGPFPVFMGPAGSRNWALMALRRGYLCALYAGSDNQDDAAALAELYPQYDFALLPRRAFAGTMALDYLETVPEADMKHVGLAGHSRDGKQILIEAGWDSRITAVVASSTGVGGTLPYRLAGERGMGEGIETTSRRFPDWFHPRLRFFTGREDRLPVDGNLLVALVAPRACLIAFGLNDWVSDAWADEQSYTSAMRVYRMLGHPELLNLYSRPGFHAIPPNDVEAYIDWLDIQFGRSSRTWISEPHFEYDFDHWRAQSGEKLNIDSYPKRDPNDFLSSSGGTISSAVEWEKKVPKIQNAVKWALGEQPPRVPPPPPRVFARGGAAPPQADDLPAIAMRTGDSFGWRKPESEGVGFERGLRFGYQVTGDLYYPSMASPSAKLPVVIWLHGNGYPMGYEWSYRWDLSPILALVKAGYAVFAYDQTGFGKRIPEAAHFFDRYPHWSQLGRMVEDTRAAIDMLQHNSRVDPEKIYLFGYSLGGTVGIYTAALDTRVRGVVSICGFTPMRTDTADRGAGGIARYSHERGLVPRLGLFAGQEPRIPYDFEDLLASIAPRPVYVMQPQLDRDANLENVSKAVDEATKVFSFYRAADMLKLDEPWDYNRLTEEEQDRIVKWMLTCML